MLVGKRKLHAAAPTLVALLAALLGIPLLLRVLGFPTGEALRAFWTGSLGSEYAITSATLVRATTLALTGLAVALAFQAGVFNIGAEGQLLVGAAAAAAVGSGIGSRSGIGVLVELVAGAAAGALWAGISAFLRARFRVLEVISTILLNFVGLYLVGYLVRGPLQEPLHIYPQSQGLPSALRLPRLTPSTRLHVGFIIAVVAAAVLWGFLRYTAAGFRLRAAGANPDSASIAGEIDVVRTTTVAFLLSGAVAGLAGAVELTGVTFALYENISSGYGYTGIAVALLARLNPLAVMVSAFVLGALESGATAMQRDAGIPSVIASIAEGVIILALISVGRSPLTLRSPPSIAMDSGSPATGPAR
jgi:simple sugar transport system permease protein